MDSKTQDAAQPVGDHSEYQDVTVTGTARIHASRMEEALLQENPYAWRKSLLKLYAVIFVGYLCSATNGFDANTFGKKT